MRPTIDVVLPLFVTLFLLAALSDEAQVDPSPTLTYVGVPAAIIQGVALVWRRSRPVLVTVLALAGGLVFHVVVPEFVVPFTGLIAICSLAALRPPVVSVPALLALVALSAANFRTTTAEDAYFTMAMAVVAWALGEVVRNRRVAVEQGTRRAVADERARIAREIHDVVAHSVSVIVVQAAAADDVFETRPDQARQALRSIEATGREALGELRQLLAAVRPSLADSTGAGAGAGDGDAAPARPQPALSRVDELAGPLRAAGLDVAIERVGAVRPLTPGVDVSAYRIVQEALTNTLRHAKAKRVEVTIAFATDTIELDVVDDGIGVSYGFDGADASGHGGHGIIGMRERAGMLGGTLEAGPATSGGYRVHASLPTRTERR